MPVCVVVLADQTSSKRLSSGLQGTTVPLQECRCIPPNTSEIDAIELLNPSLVRQRRQRSMARWLMPFGFMAGITFTKITNLNTFAAFGPWGESLISGFLGMGSGLMGSYAAAASVNSDNEDGVRILRNRHQEGCWLMLIETPAGIEIPWQLVQQCKPIQVVRLSDL